MFPKNVGTVDRIIRLLIGAAVIAAGFYYKSWWGLLAIIPIGTALVGRCGPYYLLGINTSKLDANKSVADVPPKT